MSLTSITLPGHRLTPGEDIACARAMEAGIYARYLLTHGVDDPRLHEVKQLGDEARDRLTHVGIKMAMQMAYRSASAYDLPVEDLFQDACLAVLEAVPRYDHARGVRFTTFVHEYLFQALAEGARHRVGAPTVSRADRRAARQALLARDRLSADGQRASLVAASLAAGVSPTAALRGQVTHVSLDDVTAHDVASESGFDDISASCTDFLHLLHPRDRRILQWRYGLDGPAKTLTQIGELEGASASTVGRWIRDALDATRALLEADRTTLDAAMTG